MYTPGMYSWLEPNKMVSYYHSYNLVLASAMSVHMVVKSNEYICTYLNCNCITISTARATEVAIDTVECPDKKGTCPGTQTCCIMPDGDYGCCPYTKVSLARVKSLPGKVMIFIKQCFHAVLRSCSNSFDKLRASSFAVIILDVVNPTI